MRMRFQKYMNYSQIHDVNGNNISLTVDTIHFDSNEISLQLVKSLSEIYPPLPVNYIKAQASGWV